MATDQLVTNGETTGIPESMNTIIGTSTMPEETTFWDEVGTDWRTGVYILAGIRFGWRLFFEIVSNPDKLGS